MHLLHGLLSVISDVFLAFLWLWYFTCLENVRIGTITKTGNSPTPSGRGILGSILNIYELKQMFHSQLINKIMIKLLTIFAFMGPYIQ